MAADKNSEQAGKHGLPAYLESNYIASEDCRSGLAAEFPKNSREVVRVGWRFWNGRLLIELRVYYKSTTGEWLPGAKGLSLQAKCFPDLKQSVLALERSLADIPHEQA